MRGVDGRIGNSARQRIESRDLLQISWRSVRSAGLQKMFFADLCLSNCVLGKPDLLVGSFESGQLGGKG